DLVEHGVQVAGLLADVDHVDDHVVDETALLERLGDGLALADRFVDALVTLLEDGVHARLAHDRQGFEDGHARGDQGAERAHGAGHHRLFVDFAHDLHRYLYSIHYIIAVLGQAYELEHEQEADRNEGQHVPVLHEPARGVDEGFGDPRQLQLEVEEDLLELRDDEDHDEGQDGDGDEDDDRRVDHGALDAAGQALGLFLELREGLEDDFDGAAGLAGLDHVHVEAVEALGVLAERLAQGRAGLDVVDDVDEGVLEHAGTHLVLEDLEAAEDGQAGVLQRRELAREGHEHLVVDAA